MEAIKKKLAILKEEKEAAVEKAEEAERQKKDAQSRAEAVSDCFAKWEGCVRGGGEEGRIWSAPRVLGEEET